MTTHLHAYEAPSDPGYVVLPDGPQPPCLVCGKGISNKIHRAPELAYHAEMLKLHEETYRALFGKDCDDPDCEFHHPEVREDLPSIELPGMWERSDFE